MPELPEVETVVRDLRPLLVGRRIGGVFAGRRALRRPFQSRWRSLLLGRTVRAVDRRGKWIRIDLEGRFLLVHLGMTGQFTVVSSGEKRQDHTHVVFGLDDGGRELRFRDVRRFGSVTFFPDAAAVESFFSVCGLGPEPWDVDAAYWRERLARARRCLKAVLLDQTVVAGVGNIYADESLFEAKLDPRLRACDLKTRPAERLRQAIVRVLERAIGLRGSSIRDYVGGSGLQGGFQREFRVYGRDGEPCLRCRTPIAGIRLAGRSTHFCPKCQKTR
ncbi:MAG: bifunctional DNA-formamidopyrimidine glycosylase/DNA-(apurinic or apyrimidinic site) lyase [Gemmataceae bacterium]